MPLITLLKPKNAEFLKHPWSQGFLVISCELVRVFVCLGEGLLGRGLFVFSKKQQKKFFLSRTWGNRSKTQSLFYDVSG